MTTAKYFPPLGRKIDKLTSGGKPEDEWGVIPDKGHEVKISREEKQELADLLRDKELIDKREKPENEKKAAFKDKQLDAALQYLKEKVGAKTAKKPG